MMRMPLPFKLVALAVLGVGTVFATGAILAAGGANPPRKPTIALTSRVAGPDDRPPQAVPPHPRLNARCRIKSIEYQAIEGMIHVAAEADVYDKHQGRYVWSFRLFDTDDKRREDPLYQKIYDDQVFSPQQLHGPPTFKDVIQPSLPPGEYLAEIAISRPHPESGGLEAVRDPARARDQRRAAKCRVITIE